MRQQSSEYDDVDAVAAADCGGQWDN